MLTKQSTKNDKRTQRNTLTNETTTTTLCMHVKLAIVGKKNHKKKKKTDDNGDIHCSQNRTSERKTERERERKRESKKQKNGKKATQSANFKIKAFGSHIVSNVHERKIPRIELIVVSGIKQYNVILLLGYILVFFTFTHRICILN